jgi:hypothetical protein
MCQKSLRKHITLPENDWFLTTDEGMLLTYFIDDTKRFITFNSREEVAEFLLQQGFIESYTGCGKSTRMYSKKIFTIEGKKGEPVQWIRRAELKWEKIKLNPSDVIYFASQHEFELQTSPILSSIGLAPLTKPKGKVVTMANSIVKEAA